MVVRRATIEDWQEDAEAAAAAAGAAVSDVVGVFSGKGGITPDFWRAGDGS